MVLVGGEPGIGKSTLLLQVAGRLQELGHSTLYVSGEESPLQVKLRAERLHGSAEDVALLNETLLETIIATAGSQRFDALVVEKNWPWSMRPTVVDESRALNEVQSADAR